MMMEDAASRRMDDEPKVEGGEGKKKDQASVASRIK